MLELFLVFLLSHFAADFLMQTNKMIDLKKIRLHRGLAKHSICHFVVSIIGVLVYASLTEGNGRFIALMAAAAIALIHYFIDWLKESMGRKYKRVTISAIFYILDQILHVITIVVILKGFGLISYTFGQFGVDSLDFLFGELTFSDSAKLLWLLIILIVATEGTGYFLGIVLRDLSPNPALEKGTYNITNEKTEMKTTFTDKGEKSEEITTTKTEQLHKDSPQKIGRYIGMIERLLIMIFIIQGTPYGLPFLIAVKSFTRFKQLENKQFAEYYLIGSMLSALIAVMLGYAVVLIL
ncbi:MAG TPA: DUF3307 domain-containing protein [Bacillales bacterium]